MKAERQAIETIRAALNGAIGAYEELVDMTPEISETREALAALDLLTVALDRAEQAEKAPAEIGRRWRERHARADKYDDTGAHDAAQHARAVATGLGEALAILETALKEIESDSNSGASGGETG